MNVYEVFTDESEFTDEVFTDTPYEVVTDESELGLVSEENGHSRIRSLISMHHAKRTVLFVELRDTNSSPSSKQPSLMKLS